MMENHVQTIISFIVLCTLGWVGVTTQKNTELLFSLKSEVMVMKAKNDISAAQEYSRQDAKADLAYRDARIDTVDQRISRLEYENRTVERLRYDDWKRQDSGKKGVK